MSCLITSPQYFFSLLLPLLLPTYPTSHISSLEHLCISFSHTKSCHKEEIIYITKKVKTKIFFIEKGNIFVVYIKFSYTDCVVSHSHSYKAECILPWEHFNGPYMSLVKIKDLDFQNFSNFTWIVNQRSNPINSSTVTGERKIL